MPALKNFGITFLISALVFGIVAYFLVGFLTSTVSGILDAENDRLNSMFTEAPDVTTDPDKKNPSEIPVVEGDSFTVMFALTDKREDLYKYLPKEEKEIEKIVTDPEKSLGLLSENYRTVKVRSIVLVRICKETGEYSIIPVPAISKVYTQLGAGNSVLEDVLYFYDSEYFTQKVASMTGITPDYTVTANISEMAEIIKEIGGFTIKVSDNIYSDGVNYLPEPPPETTGTETTVAETEPPVTDDGADGDSTAEPEKIEIKKIVSQGNVTVGATNIEAILLYEGYADDGVDRRYELHVEFVKGLLGKLSGMDDGKLGSLFAKLTSDKRIETAMTKEQLLEKADLIRAYKDFNTTVYEYPGKMEGDYFKPDIMGAAKQFLGLRIPADPAKG